MLSCPSCGEWVIPEHINPGNGSPPMCVIRSTVRTRDQHSHQSFGGPLKDTRSRYGAELDGGEGMYQVDPPEGSPGQGLAEYALILALIAVIAIAALVFLGPQISTILSSIGQGI